MTTPDQAHPSPGKGRSGTKTGCRFQYSKRLEELMNIIQRVQDILLKPKATWPEIEQEPGDIPNTYKSYLLPLALIPAVAGFIGMSLIGVSTFGANFRIPLLTGLVNMVVGFVLSLAMVYVLSLIVNALAPTFGGTKNPMNAFKLVAFGSTAGFLGGIFSLLPALSLLGLLAALYSIYLIYTGLPVLMKNPAEKSAAYTAVILVCGVVASLIVGAITALVSPGAGSAALVDHDNASVNIKIPGGGEIAINSAKMEEIAKKMEQAKASGNTADVAKAANDMLGAVTGRSGTPIAAAELKAYLPVQIEDFKRDSIEAKSNAAMGFAASSALATYIKGEQNLSLEISDVGGLGGLASVAGWASSTLDREDSTSVEKVYRQGKRTLHEDYQKDGSQSEFTLVLENGVIVTAKGNRLDMTGLKAALSAIDLNKLEKIARPTKS